MGKHHEAAQWRVATTIKKYKNQEDYEKDLSSTEYHIDNNTLLVGGAKNLFELLLGTSGYTFTPSTTYIGVGDSNYTDSTDRQLTTLRGNNAYFKKNLSAFPRVQENYSFVAEDGTSQVFDVCIITSATYYGNEANFIWQEFGIGRGNSESDPNMLMLNRRVLENPIQKSLGEILNVTVAINIY